MGFVLGGTSVVVGGQPVGAGCGGITDTPFKKRVDVDLKVRAQRTQIQRVLSEVPAERRNTPNEFLYIQNLPLIFSTKMKQDSKDRNYSRECKRIFTTF